MNDEKPRDFYRELRCQNCRKLICLEYIFDGWIKFICKRCGEENVFHFKHRKGAKNDILASGDQTNNNYA